MKMPTLPPPMTVAHRETAKNAIEFINHNVALARELVVEFAEINRAPRHGNMMVIDEEAIGRFERGLRNLLPEQQADALRRSMAALQNDLLQLNEEARHEIEKDRALKWNDLRFSVGKRVATTVAVMTTVLVMLWIAHLTGAYVPAWMHPEQIKDSDVVKEAVRGE